MTATGSVAVSPGGFPSGADRPLRLGLIINPWAGMGGPLALKGSDGQQAYLAARDAPARAPGRAQRTLRMLADSRDRCRLLTWGGAMGADTARLAGFDAEVLGEPSVPSCAADTRRAAEQLLQSGIDLLLFAGGDGTARDIVDAIGGRCPVLGIPAGVKMHSGVFALSPEAAAEVVLALLHGDMVDIGAEEVRDIDEEGYRQGRVNSRFYGELQVPRIGGYIQHTKIGGREVEELTLADIAAELEEDRDPEALYLFGPGSTTAGILESWGHSATLLGVDALRDDRMLGADLDAAALEALVVDHAGPVYLVVTAIGGQGIVFGRGNQQFSPALIRRAGREGLIIVATKTKLTELGGRPLQVDTDDPQLDRDLAGLVTVVTGYRDRVLYPLGIPSGTPSGIPLGTP